MAHYEMQFTLQWTINSGCTVIFPDSSNTSTWKGKAVPFSIFRISESGFTFNWRGGPVKNTQLQNNSYILDKLWDTEFQFSPSQRVSKGKLPWHLWQQTISNNSGTYTGLYWKVLDTFCSSVYTICQSFELF